MPYRATLIFVVEITDILKTFVVFATNLRFSAVGGGPPFISLLVSLYY